MAPRPTRRSFEEMLSGRRRRILGAQAPRVLALGLMALLLLARYADPLPLVVLRQQVFDLYQRMSPREEATPRVMIVDIDEASLVGQGQWPWSRSTVAQLLDRIVAAGPKVVAFDMMFAEADRLSPRAIAGRLREQAPEVADALAALPDTDAQLAASVAAGPVVLAEALLVSALPADASRAPPIAVPVTVLDDEPGPYLLSYVDSLRNLPELEIAARGHGGITLPPESDNVVRSVPLMTRVHDRLVPALAIEMLRVAAGENNVLVRTGPRGITNVIVGGRVLGTDGRGQKAVHFGRPVAGRYLSAGAILADPAAAAPLRDKLVLVGSSATGLYDIKATPIARAMPGVEVHAHLLETILAGTDLNRPVTAVGAEIVLSLALWLAVLILVPRLGALTTLLLGGAVAALLVGGSWYLFRVHQMLIDSTFPAFSALIVYSLLVYINYLREEGRRKSIRRAFARYLPEDMIERLVQDPSQLRLGGEQRPATVMFVDIRGFTGIAERLPADQLTSFVNRTLTCITTAVQAHGGTIDKYIGDATMAFWNAPLRDPGHERHACEAALAVLAAVRLLDDELRAEVVAGGPAWPPLRVGIGINSGDCFIGNMGSSQRFNYSAMGNTVNIAARLETLCKTYGCPIIVGEATAAGAPEAAFLDLDEVMVRGHSRTSRILALLGGPELRRDPVFSEILAAREEMAQALANADGVTAATSLRRLRELAATLPDLSLDAISLVLAGRLEAMQATGNAARPSIAVLQALSAPPP